MLCVSIVTLSVVHHQQQATLPQVVLWSMQHRLIWIHPDCCGERFARLDASQAQAVFRVVWLVNVS